MNDDMSPGALALAEALNWRYAVKKMTGDKLPENRLEAVLSAIRMAPSSRGLQPYKVLVIEDAALKNLVRPIADDQPQITECSHLLVFAAWASVTEVRVEDFLRFAAAERNVPLEKLDKVKAVLARDQLKMSAEQFYHWASKQIYLALGMAIASASLQRIDAAPLEGFDAAKLDTLLGLREQGLRSTVLLGLGYRDPEDWMGKLKKVRRPRSELFASVTEL